MGGEEGDWDLGFADSDWSCAHMQCSVAKVTRR